MEQEAGPHPAVLEQPSQLPGLLDHPGAGGRGGAAGEVDTAAADLHQEEDVKALEPDRLHGEEIDRQHLVGVLADELTPGALAAARRRQEPVASEHVAHGAVRAAAAQLQELALDAPVPHLGFSLARRTINSWRSALWPGRPVRGRRV